jgi:flagellar biosynthesis chaperone FliJ
MSKQYDAIHSEFSDVEKKIDSITKKDGQYATSSSDKKDIPMELKKVKDNLDFINKVNESNIKKGAVTTEVFGCETVDISSILKMNLWNRSIYTVDMLDKMIAKMTLNQLKKYLPKKGKKGFEYWWLVLLIIMGGIAITLVIVFLLPRLAGIKLF